MEPIVRSVLVGLVLPIIVVAVFAGPALAALPGGIAIEHDARARELKVSARWSAPRVETNTRGDQAVAIDGLPGTLDAGMPSVPVRTIKVALPRGMRLKAVHTADAPARKLAARVSPAHSMLPYSWQTLDHNTFAIEEAPRIPAAGFPANRVQTSVQVLHHVPVVIVNVYPVVVAADGGATVTSDAQVTLSYEPEPAERAFRALTAREAADVAALVDNPESVTQFAPTAEPADAYDYLILSSADLIAYTGAGSLTDLTANLASRGLKARVFDVAKAATTGKDLQDKIRNFIRGEYEKSGIRYVLLAADGDESGAGSVIPARRFFQKINSYDGHWHTIQNNIPCDLYYSCLDGDFDGNGNGVWGETTDGKNGGDVDLLAEVVIGRMPMKTTTELKNFVTKTIAYAANTGPQHALLMGEELFAEMNLYGDDYMNQLVGACTDHAYQTQGYGPSWTISHLYDREHSWGGSEAVTKISQGDFAVVHHLGHSNTTYNMRCYSSRIKKFTNPKPFFYYTQGCFPGDFTEDDCFIELMVRHEHAAVAAIANTCYGLGPEDPQANTTVTPGASQMLHRKFVDSICFGGADSMGKANQMSKQAFIGLASAGEMRWVFWDAHYFGDPSLKGAK